MKKKIVPVLIIAGLILLLTAGIFITSLFKKYSPSTDRMDLTEYYNITSDEQVPIILNYALTDAYCIRIDGNIYLDYQFVHDTLNSRFYWDANENILLYTTSTDLISANADSSSYLITKSSVDFGAPIVKATADSAFINIDFVKQYTDLTYDYFENPSRIVINNTWGDIQIVSPNKDTVIRQKGGIKSAILCDVSKGDVLTVIDREENWTKVMSPDGIIGYVRLKFLTDESTQTISNDFVKDTFSHITKDFKISMAWHQVFDTSANSSISDILSRSKGINVISPTWFTLNDNQGNLSSLASLNYVDYCHSQGVEVWPIVGNLENNEVDTSYVLTHTSTRSNLVNQIVSLAIQYNLDGINLDFEAMDSSAVGESYIQFIRELSLKCANNGIVLSVDNYVPSSYTAFYNRAEQANFADYIVIMAYDEHYSGSEPGSVASLSWVKEGVTNTLKEVPAQQTILGIPFYSRVWCLTPNSDDSDTEIIYDITSKAYGMRSATALIEDNNATMEWLDDCGQYYSEFENNGSIYKIWLEDNHSLEEKLKVINDNQLAGAGFWKLGFESASTWDTVIKYIN